MDPAQTLAIDTDGLIGLPLISLFDIATEAGPGKIWLARNTLKPAADPYPRSGLWFDRKGADTFVAVVGQGSPAEAAGIRVGDVVTMPATMPAAIKLVEGDAGQVVSLSIRRNGAVIERRLTLADYL